MDWVTLLSFVVSENVVSENVVSENVSNLIVAEVLDDGSETVGSETVFSAWPSHTNIPQQTLNCQYKCNESEQ